MMIFFIAVRRFLPFLDFSLPRRRITAVDEAELGLS